jgi:hypothetical protein
LLDHSCQVQRAPLSEHRGDCYDTPAVAVRALLKAEHTFFSEPRRVWECACGIGNIVLPLRAAGHEVIATDLNDRGCPESIDRIDFLLPMRCDVDAIVTNPPYSLAEKFVATALERAPVVIMLLRLAFMESERRSAILDNGTLARVHVFSNRLPLMHREGWTGNRASSSIAFAWFCWSRDHHGPATIDRIRWEAE